MLPPLAPSWTLQVTGWDALNAVARRIPSFVAVGDTVSVPASPPLSGDASPEGPSPVGPSGSSGFDIAVVADTANQTIRLLDTSKNVVTTVAGTPGTPGTADGTGAAARFNGPGPIAVGSSGSRL
jgi:hypothetical protein